MSDSKQISVSCCPVCRVGMAQFIQRGDAMTVRGIDGGPEYTEYLGTKPDFYSSREISPDPAINRAAFREMAEGLKDRAAWLRYTVDVTLGYLWVEGWKARPEKEARFDPPYTLPSREATA